MIFLEEDFSIDELLHPEVNKKIAVGLEDSNVYEKLLVMYESQKEKDHNELQVFLGGKTILLSPKQIYLHLKYKTPFANYMVSTAEQMEEFVGDAGKVSKRATEDGGLIPLFSDLKQDNDDPMDGVNVVDYLLNLGGIFVTNCFSKSLSCYGVERLGFKSLYMLFKEYPQYVSYKQKMGVGFLQDRVEFIKNSGVDVRGVDFTLYIKNKKEQLVDTGIIFKNMHISMITDDPTFVRSVFEVGGFEIYTVNDTHCDVNLDNLNGLGL